jgi:hypothetical protein
MYVYILFLFCITSVISLKSQPPSYVPTNGLIGWWGFNGNANDESGNGHNGSVSNASLTTDRNNVANAAYLFNGSNSKIEVNANSMFDIQKVSISVWTFSTSSGNQKIVSKSNWSNAGSETFSLNLPSNGDLTLNTKYQSNCVGGNGWKTPVTNPKPNDYHNNWHHIVVTYDNTIAKLYIDGCLIKASTSNFPIDICTGGQLKFGAWWANDPAWFQGKLDDIGLWNRALTETEVKSLYAASNPLTANFPGNYSTSCNGVNDATASVVVIGGNPPYTYSWNSIPIQTTQTAYGLSPGNYTVTVSDSKCQTTTATVLVNQPIPISASIQVDNNVSCTGGRDGKATIQNIVGGTPPFTYEWSTDPIQKTQSAFNLTAGKYNAVVKDSKGCLAIGEVIISEPSTPISNVEAIAVQHIACFGDSTGIVSVSTPTGGTPPYVYNWHTVPMKTTQTISNLPAGTYKVVVADSKGCYLTSTVELTQPEKELSDIEFEIIKEIDCNGNKNGSIGIKNPQGGTPPYTFTWNTDSVQTSQIIKNLSSGMYAATIRDKNNCTRTKSIELKEPTQVIANVSVIKHVSCYGKKDGIVTVKAMGGTPPYSYLWSTTPTQFGDTLELIGYGEYFVMVSDSKGCVVEKSVIVLQPDSVESPVVLANQNRYFLCKGDSRGLFVMNETRYQSYNWIFNGQEITEYKDKRAILAFMPGEYKVLSTKNGCSYESNTIIIEEKELPNPIIKGKMIVESGEKNVEYQTNYSLASIYKWSIQGNADFVNKNDNHKVNIDFKSIQTDSVLLTVQEIDTNECINDTSIQIRVRKSTNINEANNDNAEYTFKKIDRNMYVFKCSSFSELPISNIELYDIMGRKVSQLNHLTDVDTVKINTEGIQSGAYLLIIKLKTMIFNCRLLID